MGYAARALGWDRIICLYNEKYGCIEELPFDLNHRRILQYNSDNKNEKDRVVQGLSSAVKLMYTKGLLFNPLKDYMKGKIDYCLLGILKQVSCMVYGTVSMSEALAKIPPLLSLEKKELLEVLKARESILGFFAHNDLSDINDQLNQRLVHLTTSNLYPLEWSTIVLELLDWMRRYQHLVSGRGAGKLYCGTLSPSHSLEVISAYQQNPTNPPNSYLLVKKLGKDGGQILYSATIRSIDKKHMLSPFRINELVVNSFHCCLLDIILLGNRWLDETGGEFVLDPDYTKF